MKRRTIPRRGVAFVVVTCALVTGCVTVGPNYARPEMSPPAAYRDSSGQQPPESLADVPWWEVFQDEALQALIREAGWTVGFVQEPGAID